ncbi:MAG: AAA family ATPase [Mollicutes bacterium PWAP]|nr:AAA family ATPase [Mollicutes bacterium PWAP]
MLFIDEIHAVNNKLEKLFYSLMDEFYVSVKIGEEKDSKIINMKVPNFIFITTTNNFSNLSPPFTGRFDMICHLTFYNEKEIIKIIKKT